MTLETTNRMVTAVLVAATAIVVAALAGRAEAALLAAPWAVLLILGLAGTGRQKVTAGLALARDRVEVDSTVVVETTVEGLDGGWVEALWRPPSGFTQQTTPPAAAGQHRAGTNGPENGADSETDRDDPDSGDTVDGAAQGSVDWLGLAVGEVVDTNGRVELRCGLPAMAWGTHDVGQVEIRIHQPFGLIVGRGLARQTLPVRVHPRPIDLRRLLAPWHVRRLTGSHRSRAAARGVEYADIRVFGPGDSPRDINWRASARSNELLVSQRHPDRSTHAILLIDSFVDSSLDFPTILGETIEAAMALAESHLSASDRVGLIDLGGIIRWVTPGSGRHHLQRLVDALLLTQVYPSDAERAITTAPPHALPSRSFVLALSPLLDKRFTDSLHILRAAGHDVALVELEPAIDASSPRWQQTEFSALALRLWRAERDLTRDRLAGHGVAVARRTVGPRPIANGATDRDRDSERKGNEHRVRETDAEPWDQTLHLLTTARRRLGPIIRA